jgi:hypothetical protein
MRTKSHTDSTKYEGEIRFFHVEFNYSLEDIRKCYTIINLF